jgi:hypothetical protein
MPHDDSDRERRRRRSSRDPESDRERRRDPEAYRRRRGHRATDSQGELLPRNGDRSSRDHSSNDTPRSSRKESKGGSSRKQQLSTGSLAQLNTVNAKQGFKQQEYDVDYLEEVRTKERRLEKERRRGEREAERERRRADKHAEREERRRLEELQQEEDAAAERERLREEERERRREEKRKLRREEKEKRRQLELAQEQAPVETRDNPRNAEREKQRQFRKEEERERRRKEAARGYEDDYDYASSPAVHTPHKTKWKLGADYAELHNEESPRTKYFEKAHSPKRKSRVVSGPYLEDQRSDEVYEYRKEKLGGSSDASDYTSTTVWKTKRNKRICEHQIKPLYSRCLTKNRYICLCLRGAPPHHHTGRGSPIEEEIRRIGFELWHIEKLVVALERKSRRQRPKQRTSRQEKYIL